MKLAPFHACLKVQILLALSLWCVISTSNADTTLVINQKLSKEEIAQLNNAFNNMLPLRINPTVTWIGANYSPFDHILRMQAQLHYSSGQLKSMYSTRAKIQKDIERQYMAYFCNHETMKAWSELDIYPIWNFYTLDNIKVASLKLGADVCRKYLW